MPLVFPNGLRPITFSWTETDTEQMLAWSFGPTPNDVLSGATHHLTEGTNPPSNPVFFISFCVCFAGTLMEKKRNVKLKISLAN